MGSTMARGFSEAILEKTFTLGCGLMGLNMATGLSLTRLADTKGNSLKA